jgi:hypothetical protein
MDLRPRTPSPPARPAHRAAPGAVQKKPASGKAVPVLPGSTAVLNGGSAAKDKLPAGRGKAAAAVSGVHQTQRVECWVYGEGGAGGAAPESSSKSGTIAQSDIARFLREPPRKSLAGNKAPVAGLQLVCHRQHISMERPFDESSFRAINAALGLLPRHEYLTALNAGACGKYIAAAGNLGTFSHYSPNSPAAVAFSQRAVPCIFAASYLPGHLAGSLLTRSQVFIYRRSSNNGTISAVINYNSDSNITRGYILMGPRIPIKKVCDEILSQFPYFSHPLLIPTLLVELTAADLMSELYHIHHSLASVENKTRFGDWELSDTTAECPDGEEREEEGADGTNEKWDGAASESENDDNEDNNGEAPGHNWLGGKVREVGMDLGSPYWAAMERAMRECSSKHEMARLLGTLSCRFAFMKVAVGCSVSMAEFTLREMDHMKTYAVTPARFRQLAKITNGECLRHRVELLLSNLQHMNTFAAIDQRMQAQQNIASRGPASFYLIASAADINFVADLQPHYPK